MPTFATFWGGQALTPYELACFKSFLAKGFALTVYSYAPLGDLPPDIDNRDAHDITPQENMGAFIIRGKANLSHFSDLFRYNLFLKTSHIWVDADMLLLKDVGALSETTLVAKEDGTSICGAIMRLDSANPALADLVQKTLGMRNKELVWGATGPRLLTAVFGAEAVMKSAYEPRYFFPIHFNESWKMFLPEYREECDALCNSAYAVHLWNDRLVKLGIWKKIGPPKGSFLYEVFEKDGGNAYFSDFYPESVVERMAENWRIRCEGGDIGLGQWLKQAVPSARLTYKRRLNLPT